MRKPAIAFLLTEFREQSENAALIYGMPGVRTQYIRGPVWGRNAEQVRRQIVDGNNPLTGQSMMQEVISKLTAPLTAAEKDMAERIRDIGPPTFTDTEENLHRLFLERRFTDFLPIVLPTAERVNAMLAQTSHDPDSILGRMNPGSAAGQTFTYTVRTAAINAVMAGARPEYFPVILAIGSTGTTSVNISDNGFGNGAVINGAIRDEIGLNYDIGAIGPFSQANLTIGRAWSLLSINGGDSGKVGTTYMGTVGNPANLVNIILAENEEMSPWEPLSVRRGFRRGESVITLLQGWGVLSAKNWAVVDWSSTPDYAGTIRDIYRQQDPMMGTFAVLSPPIAQFIYDAGFTTVDKLNDFVRVPDPNAKPLIPSASKGATATKPGTQAGGNFNVIVTGSTNNNYWMIGGMGVGRSVPIDKWR
jgi:hypothetical protein